MITSRQGLKGLRAALLGELGHGFSAVIGIAGVELALAYYLAETGLRIRGTIAVLYIVVGIALLGMGLAVRRVLNQRAVGDFLMALPVTEPAIKSSLALATLIDLLVVGTATAILYSRVLNALGVAAGQSANLPDCWLTMAIYSISAMIAFALFVGIDAPWIQYTLLSWLALLIVWIIILNGPANFSLFVSDIGLRVLLVLFSAGFLLPPLLIVILLASLRRYLDGIGGA